MNRYYESVLAQLAADPSARIRPFGSSLYTGHRDFNPGASSPKFQFLSGYIQATPGSSFVVFGERTGGTVAELFSNYNARAYLFAEVDGHANPFTLTPKDGSYGVQDVLRGLEPGRLPGLVRL